jgi:hypothetical protein
MDYSKMTRLPADGRHEGDLVLGDQKTADAFRGVRHINGDLPLYEGVTFQADELAYVAGNIQLNWESHATLDACKFVQGSLNVWGDATLRIGCEGVGLGIQCGQSAQVSLPNCTSVGKTHNNSVHLSGSARVDAPRLAHVTGGLDLTENSVLKAPAIAMALAQAALAAAQRRVDQALETGALAAAGYSKPVRASSKLMREGLDAAGVAAKAMPRRAAPAAANADVAELPRRRNRP